MIKILKRNECTLNFILNTINEPFYFQLRNLRKIINSPRLND
jgi:hypothetical protein